MRCNARARPPPQNAGEMAFAYFIGNAGISIFPTVNGGPPAALFCFLYLYLALAGGGA